MKNIACIITDENHRSRLSTKEFALEERGGMLLTQRIDAKNFRIRESNAGYRTDWHIAGDPTFISIQQGVLRITLQDGTSKDFKAGDSFIAADFLPESIDFDPTIHGHRAEVVGEEKLVAIHIKLDTTHW